MSSETDHPRQRTVAELLAEHGDAAATGRRRRRREPDEFDDVAGPAHSAFTPSTPVVDRRPTALPPPPEPVWSERPVWSDRAERPALPDRSVLRDPVPSTPAAPPVARVVPEEPRARRAAPVFPSRPVAEPEREHPTDVMPRFRDTAARVGVDEGLTGPMPQQPAPRSVPDDDADAGPSTMIGAAPVGAESWHEARTQDARHNGTSIDGGTALPPGPDVDRQPAGPGRRRTPLDMEEHDTDDGDVLESPKPRERRLGRAAAVAESTGPAWATVMMQWVAGAVGGAVLWVAFRFLWRNLPVVALASAVLVTVGLVVIVRALLHNDDRRTTIFAVLVGLLLTVSPAILVLLGR